MPHAVSSNGSDPSKQQAGRPASGSVASRIRSTLETVAGGALSQRAFGVRFWDGSELPATSSGCPTLVVRDPRALAYLLRAPTELGLGRAWVSGALDVDGDLEPLLNLRDSFDGLKLSVFDRLRMGTTVWRAAGREAFRSPPVPAAEARPRGPRHSLGRDRAAIRYHYDAPPAFYQMVLGPSLVYSCAYYDSPEEPLERAQQRKLELICRKLRLWPGARLLDIGCGWGSLLVHAAVHHGVQGVGVTLSPAQAEVARQQAQQRGVADRCDVRVADYRELEGEQFDAIASVGMYEHVGRDHLNAYVKKAHDLLRPGGLFLNHGIARLKPRQVSKSSFIARFVFPDGELHPVSDLLTALQHSGLELRDIESLREHYPLTLQQWLANLAAHRDAVIMAAGAERERIFRLYMTAAATAFSRGELSVFQTLAMRPGKSRLPLTRTYLANGARSVAAFAPAILPGESSPVRAT